MKIQAAIKEIEALNTNVYRVRLDRPANTDFVAGQYLDLVLPSGKQCSFSIASAPEHISVLELHIRHLPDSEISKQVIQHLQSTTTVEIELPKGSCHLTISDLEPQTHLILMAASTGFAQIKSIVEHLLAQEVTNRITIYWGVRAEEDFYWLELPEQWAQNHANIVFIPVLSEPKKSSSWQGSVGLLPEVFLADQYDFRNVKMLVSGSPDMVYALLDAVLAKGFKQENMQSDVFSYAPRA